MVSEACLLSYCVPLAIGGSWGTRPSSDLLHPDNRVTIDGHANIHLAKTYHNTEPHRRLLTKFKALLALLGCHQMTISRSLVLSHLGDRLLERLGAPSMASAVV